jgi:hypothetical protein
MSSIHERPSRIQPETGRILCSRLVTRDKPCPAKRGQEENKPYRIEPRKRSHYVLISDAEIVL